MSRRIAAIRVLSLTSVSWILWLAVFATGSGGACSSGFLGLTGSGGDAPPEPGTGGRGFGGGGDTGGSPTGTGGWGGDTGGSPPGTGGWGGDAGAGFIGDGGSGAAGSGGIGGGIGDGGGIVCPPPLSSFGCAATYDEQVANGVCLSMGRITAGPCGSGWDWHCASITTNDCLYDASKKLLGAKHCDEASNEICYACTPTAGSCNCFQSSGYMTDGGPACNPSALGD